MLYWNGNQVVYAETTATTDSQKRKSTQEFKSKVHQNLQFLEGKELFLVLFFIFKFVIFRIFWVVSTENVSLLVELLILQLNY